jgi:hypothetical protein
MQHILPTELLNRVIAYLATKAYSEVMGLIHEMQTKAVLVPEVPAADPTTSAAPVAPPESK